MRMESKVVNGILVLTPLERRVEAASSAGFKGHVIDWINQGHARIVLDLINVDFIDSSGLGAIISCLKSVGENGDLCLSRLSKPVTGLFELTRMDRVFRIFDTPQAAISSLTR